jgi:hypothetical protein
MGLLKIHRIDSGILATNGKDNYVGILLCTKDQTPATYLVQVLEDNQMPKGMTFLLCEECFQDMVTSCQMQPMSLN